MSALLYSVHLRDRGTSSRGFVQLPTVVDDDGNIATYPVDPSVLSQAAHCYVHLCPSAALLSCSTSCVVSMDCAHIRAAIACTTVSQPLSINSSVIDSLSFAAEEVRTLLQHFVANQSCPVVQRITRSVFVVRSQPAYECSLEFVHVTFPESVRTHSDTSAKFMCDCRIFKVQFT